MAKIPFSIDYRPQIESGEYKVETKNGVSVRIICWDAKGSNDRKDIIGLTSSNLGSENLQRYNIMGHLIADSAKIGNKDLLIITPEPELTEFEEEIRVCVTKNLTIHIKDGNGREMSSTVFIDGDTAKKMAAELLELARKQLVEEQYISNPRDTNLYKLGKTEALKDLPRWRKIDRGNNYSLNTKFSTNGRYLEMTDYLNDVYEVALSELEKLPKEDETK